MSSTSQVALLPKLSLQDGVTVWDGAALEYERRCNNIDEHAVHLMQTINILGIRSKEAQCLNTVLTSVARLRENRQARVYLLCQDGYGVGILKMGVKKLFVTHPSYSSLVEIDPLCVLDFFVDTSFQRKGFGKTLFDAMLLNEGLNPGEVAIDRPSVKFLAFLRKYYGLVEYTPQTNNFVVFHRYFDKWQPQRGKGHWGGNAVPTRSLVRPQNCLRVYPEYQSTTGPNNNFEEDATHRTPPPPPPLPPPLVPQGSVTSPGAGKKTAYELQYEEYLREQAYRRRQGGDPRFQPVPNPVSSSEIAAASCGARRRMSPTRSGVQYNIISGTPEH
ncbi:hypothetical protein TcG_03578 [Trypanosoma cruzi]|uniref:Alpha-tubulin N-acetyltransferase n=2 Tax=Trypanosoma cruzi TaxID=5693 RepID=V5BCX4_TRYCR|nr:hypothetical protein TCDM_08085 [Trypanosoma cruzi Dm28c]PBJ68605.1 alpha-tubulin N-acetyltransferase [Trypanosoma cruzi cruzi]PWU98388.1 putative alpha-tubulin N-acetyltransferase [Trypanosoma cruzi]RNF20526.1 hypothetical protein TcG_03578 [Trypanosoma cruzi]